MFFRQKRSGKYTYLQIVENRWEDGGSKQRVLVTLGRLDELREQGQLDGLFKEHQGSNVATVWDVMADDLIPSRAYRRVHYGEA